MHNQIDLVVLESSIAGRSRRFCTFGDQRECSRYMALALAGEVGELCNLVKKEWRGDPKGLDGKALLDEASDIFIYWTLFCHAHGWTIQRVMEHADQKAERKILALEAERAALGTGVEKMSEPTHYVHCNSGNALFVKEAAFFKQQGGLVDDWGRMWKPVTATSIEDARRQAAKIFNVPISSIYSI